MGKQEFYLTAVSACGQCSAVCPREAITISGYDTKPVPREETVRLNPDDVLHVIRFRRTVRQFQKKGIPEQVRDQILEAGRLTHTAKNMQDVSFVVLDRQRAGGTDGCPLIPKDKAIG